MEIGPAQSGPGGRCPVLCHFLVWLSEMLVGKVCIWAGLEAQRQDLLARIASQWYHRSQH